MSAPARACKTRRWPPTITRASVTGTPVHAALTTPDAPTRVCRRWAGCFACVPTASCSRTTGRRVRVSDWAVGDRYERRDSACTIPCRVSLCFFPRVQFHETLTLETLDAALYARLARLNFRAMNLKPRGTPRIRTLVQILHATVRGITLGVATLSQGETFDKWRSFPADVDECSVPDLQTELCRYGCINTPGSYRCAQPMELKDQPILDSLSITCLPGYEQTSHGCIGE